MAETTSHILAERLGEALLTEKMKVVTAESCTGGGIAHLITSIPGSSQWFERGFVVYSNEAKLELLRVDMEIFDSFGAVSRESAVAMAQGAVVNSHADISVAVTGVAGPDGGTPDKPVGTVCFAWSRRGGETKAASTVFEGDRQHVREQAILMAIQGLLDIIES